MKYTVVWKPAAEAELAEIWMAATAKGAIAAAGNQIDEQLKTKPNVLGESRSGNVRVWFIGPIGVTYEVLDDDRLVRVLDVWSTG
jgi:hypothetical protein